MTEIFLIYTLCLNMSTFLIMLIDKRRAIRHQWRIPEKTIFTLAFLGGACGALAGMYAFRHKTKHLSFRILLPVFLCLNLIAAYFLLTGVLF